MSRKTHKKIPVIPLVILFLGTAISLILLYILPGRYRLYQTTLYDPLEEAPANPLMGFAPEAQDIENNGDTRLVSIRLSWKDWEPVPGQYDTENLKNRYHIKYYKEKNIHGVLRFDCRKPEDGMKRDMDAAIARLGEFFSGDSFISYVELSQTGAAYADTFSKAFPQACLILPWDHAEAGKGDRGIYFDSIGSRKKQNMELDAVKESTSWKNVPNAGAFSEEMEPDQIFNEELAEVLQEIREGHITYISGKGPDKETRKGNGYRMIRQTLGYCIYISRLQTTVNLRKDKVSLRFTFKNTGVAPCYADWPVVMSIYSVQGEKEYAEELPMSVKDIPPGGELEVTGEFPYHKRLKKGYSIGISIANPENAEDHITLSQKGTRPDEKGIHIVYTFEPENSGRKADIARPDSYQNAMIGLLADMSDYAKAQNPDFAMITNGGYRLYMSKYNTSEENLMRLTSTMDGMIIESVFYGWDEKINNKTPDNMSEEMQTAIREGKEADLSVFNIEYCTQKTKREDAANKSREAGTVWYNAKDMELSRIPELVESRAHDGDCAELSEVENFLTVLNPDRYHSKADYLKALQDTDYDLIFIDQDYGGDHLTKKEIRSLKQKKNGGTRMVCAYMSVGEAENYRDYWQDSWEKNPPPWICDENRKWEGNYKVMYWTKSWRDILFGQTDSYLDQIMASGFDGVYLDVVDAYEYFEDELY